MEAMTNLFLYFSFICVLLSPGFCSELNENSPSPDLDAEPKTIEIDFQKMKESLAAEYKAKNREVATTTTTQTPTPAIPACPGESNKEYPICSHIRGTLTQTRFTNATVCVFTKPEEFSINFAWMKTTIFSAVAIFGIIGNSWVVFSGCMVGAGRHQILVLVALGDLWVVGIQLATDIATFQHSYDHWRLAGRLGCYLANGLQSAASAFSQLSLLALFIERYISLVKKSRGGRQRTAREDGQSGGGGGVLLVAAALLLGAASRMALYFSNVEYSKCVLRDNSPFELCRFDMSTSFQVRLGLKLVDLCVFQLGLGAGMVWAARYTLPVLEARARHFRFDLSTISNVKFYHTLIIIAMLSVAINTAHTLLVSFLDLLYYPVSQGAQMAIRSLPYINSGLIKPLVYLIYCRDIFAYSKQVSSRRQSQSLAHSRQSSLSRFHTLDVAVEELSTEQQIERLRVIKRRDSMTPTRSNLLQPIADESALPRSKSFDCALNMRIQQTPQKPRNSGNVPQVTQTPDRPGTHYMNLRDTNVKQKSESHLLRPASMYINLGALSRRRFNPEQDAPPAQPEEVSPLGNYESITSPLSDNRNNNRDSCQNENRTTSFSREENPDLGEYTEIRQFDKQVSVESGYASSSNNTPTSPPGPVVAPLASKFEFDEDL